MNTVVLGGTHQIDDYNTAVSEDDRKFIYDGCIGMNTSIKNAKIVKEMVGLRPFRSSVRLERDTFVASELNVLLKQCFDHLFNSIPTGNGKPLSIIHNYGHGGSGVTLSYGCAIEVCKIVRDDDVLKSKL